MVFLPYDAILMMLYSSDVSSTAFWVKINVALGY